MPSVRPPRRRPLDRPDAADHVHVGHGGHRGSRHSGEPTATVRDAGSACGAVHWPNVWRYRALFVLVTGGTGYVGSHAIAALADAGHRIRVLARSAEKIPAALGPLGIDGVQTA